MAGLNTFARNYGNSAIPEPATGSVSGSASGGRWSQGWCEDGTRKRYVAQYPARTNDLRVEKATQGRHGGRGRAVCTAPTRVASTARTLLPTTRSIRFRDSGVVAMFCGGARRGCVTCVRILGRAHRRAERGRNDQEKPRQERQRVKAPRACHGSDRPDHGRSLAIQWRALNSGALSKVLSPDPQHACDASIVTSC